MSTTTSHPQLTREQHCRRRDEIEARVRAITTRRLAVADRIGFAIAVPGLVDAAELTALRSERQMLEVELEEKLSALGVIQRMDM